MTVGDSAAARVPSNDAINGMVMFAPLEKAAAASSMPAIAMSEVAMTIDATMTNTASLAKAVFLPIVLAFGGPHRTQRAVNPFLVDSSGHLFWARHVFHQPRTIHVATPSTAAATATMAKAVITRTTTGTGSATIG